MAHHRVAVGVDGSAAAQSALEWALRQASWLNATVLVVTAWQEENDTNGAAAPADRQPRPQRTRERYRRMTELQQRCIADARQAVGAHPGPVIARVLMRADPVAALRHAGRKADLVVVGCSERPLPTSVGAGLLKSGVGLVLVSAPQLMVAPAEPALAGSV